MVTFSGTVQSDFMKSVSIEDAKKPSLVNYAATDFATLTNSLVDYIKTVYPLDYHNFAESDLGVMLIELVAYMGSVMSLKADMLANENFLRTSRKRKSIKKLLELIGIRVKGPISSAANARIVLGTAPWKDTGGAAVAGGEEISILPASRVFTTTSPEDGGILTYTLYKVLPTGLADLPNALGSIALKGSEASNDASTVFTNLVLLEGVLTVEEGTFTTAQAVKTVSLAGSPVVEGSTEVFVKGDSTTSGAYKLVDNVFFASGPADKVFQVVYDDSFGATVVFGDNTLGVSPAAGDTYTVIYRIGGGGRGNISNEVINAVVTTTSGSSEVLGVLENTSIGTGGADAETLAHAKRYAPLNFRRQDRLVTLRDMKAFSNSYVGKYGSTGKTTAATRKAFSSANIIDVYVLEKASDFQLRRATPTFKYDLLNAMNDKKMITDEIIVVDGLIRTMDLVVTLRVDKELLTIQEIVKAKARNVILDYFKVDNNDFGKPFIPEELNRRIFDVDEIRYSTVDNIDSVIKVEYNEIIQLNNLSINIVGV